jgi:hypothetical protein
MKTKTEYRTVDTSTLAGLKQAERLHANGWTQYGRGLFLVRFYRRRSAA